MKVKAFGIEIRRVGDMNGLYEEVDAVLAKMGISAFSVGKEMQKQTVAHALQNMIKVDKWFDVCCINACIDVCQIAVPMERMRVYQANHCVHWNEMLPEYRTALIAMVLDDFRSILNA